MNETPVDRALLRSAGLGQFRKNPFRLLRLPANATAQQAVWQCDKALARARVGMPLPEADPVPWLPPGDEIELQEAAQTMESPLARLVEQMLWFGDDQTLAAALAAQDAGTLRAYLEAPRESEPIERRVEQANLRLLLGYSALREVGPTLVSAAAAPSAQLAWKGDVVEDPHRLFRFRDAAFAQASWGGWLGAGMQAWGTLLPTAELAGYVRAKIVQLNDDLLTADDLEAVLSAIRTRLADLLVGETKTEMAEGRITNVAQLSAVAGKSGIDSETWLVAFRPLRTQFQSELADLDPEATTGNGAIEDIAAYIERLGAVSTRWRPLDEAQLLGLGTLVDDAVIEAFGKLRGVPRERQMEPRCKEVLDKMIAVAGSGAVKERLRTYKGRLDDFQKSMCHFCGKRELEADNCASLSSKRITNVERYGNTTRTTYQLGARPVGRCPRCAQVHGFIRYAGSRTFWTLLSTLLIVAFIHPASWFHGMDGGTSFVLIALGAGAAFGLGYVGREIAAGLVTPKGERRFSQYTGSAAYQGLRQDGFTSMNYDFRPNAWRLVNEQGIKRRHEGGASGQALRVILQVGVVVALIALRVCLAAH
ncbi:MAG TPA: hypothetical protein VGM88_00730 [Kofleriaceae bacterium]